MEMKLFKELLPYIMIVVVVVAIRAFIATPVRVDGASMNPTLEDGEILILKKYDRSLERFDIVVLDYNGEKLVKRVIGFPGEKIAYKDNKLYVDGKRVKEPFEHEVTDDFELEEQIPELKEQLSKIQETNSEQQQILNTESKPWKLDKSKKLEIQRHSKMIAKEHKTDKTNYKEKEDLEQQ